MNMAVSGDIGSFSEEAGLLYASRNGIDVTLVNSIDMEGVLDVLDRGEADMGIFPVVNSTGGIVHQAFTAMGRHLFVFRDILPLEVRQCLMVRPGTLKSHIQSIATHPQAFAQCHEYLHREFPRVSLIEWQDTAKAARDLGIGVFGKNTAVIAPARAAQIFNLEILEDDIQDRHPNLTTFIIVTK